MARYTVTARPAPRPSFTDRLWLAFGVLLIVGGIAEIPVVGRVLAYVLVGLALAGWIGSRFARAARRR